MVDLNAHTDEQKIETMARRLIDEIQTTPADGVLILNIVKQATGEKIMEIQRNMRTLANVLNRSDIGIVVTTKNEHFN